MIATEEGAFNPREELREMPELAEVIYFRKLWEAALNRRVRGVDLNPRARIFRGMVPGAIRDGLRGRVLRAADSRGKQMIFRFDRRGWLGVHLGMAGRLSIALEGRKMEPHAHFVLHFAGMDLIFEDHRQFGRIRFEERSDPPDWWQRMAPDLLSRTFDRAALAAFCMRRKNSPIKGVLLMQERFPGIGNWMADEILWRARIHPGRKAGSLSEPELKRIFGSIRWVVRGAVKTIGNHGGNPPGGWLFHERWDDNGVCPRTGDRLIREKIAGRTTCWSPRLQAEEKKKFAEKME